MSSKIETVTLRQATPQDQPFIEKMCYEAAFPEDLDDRMTFEEARQLDWFQAYTNDYPNHDGDFGVIAENESSEPIGAAWYRDYPRKDLAPDIPTHELSIALVSEARGKQIGEKLMIGLLSGAAERGVDLSLQVLENNSRAKALYEKLGFQAVAKSSEGYDVMVVRTAK